jgi:hypothetical protein
MSAENAPSFVTGVFLKILVPPMPLETMKILGLDAIASQDPFASLQCRAWEGELRGSVSLR